MKDWIYERDTKDIKKPKDMKSYLSLVGWT